MGKYLVERERVRVDYIEEESILEFAFMHFVSLRPLNIFGLKSLLDGFCDKKLCQSNLNLI